MGKEVLTLFLTVLFLAIVGLISSYRKKYQMNIRRWIGALLLCAGLIPIVLSIPSEQDLTELLAEIIIIIFGGLLLFVNPPKIKKN